MPKPLSETDCDFAVFEPAAARSSKTAAFLAHCRALQGGGPFPRWSDFKLHALAGDVIPFVAVVDVTRAAGPHAAFTYRFWGTGHTSLKGVDMTGKRVTDITTPVMARIGQRQYQMVLDQRRPLIFVHSLKGYGPWKDQIQVAVRVPLSEDGRTIDKVVSYSNYEEDRELWSDFYTHQPSGEFRHAAAR